MAQQKPFYSSMQKKSQPSLMDAWASAGIVAVGDKNAPTDNDDDKNSNTADEESPPAEDDSSSESTSPLDDKNPSTNDSNENDVFDPSYFTEDDKDQYNNGQEEEIAIDTSADIFHVPPEVAKQCRANYNSFLSNLFGVIGTGMHWNIPDFNRVLVPVDSLRQWVKRSFDALPVWIQTNIGLRNPGHQCVVYETQDILDCFQESDPLFDIDDIPNLSIDQLQAAETLLPILKTLSKQQLFSVTGGRKEPVNSFTSTNLTLFRYGIFSGRLHDEEKEEWDSIEVHPNSKAKLASGRELADQKLYDALENFSVFDAASGSLLAKVEGIVHLKNVVGNFTRSDGLSNTKELQTSIRNGNGQLLIFDDADDEFGFIIKITPNDCTETPVEDAEERITQIRAGIRSRYGSANGTGAKISNWYWIVYADKELTRVDAYGKGVNNMKEKLSELKRGTTKDQYKKGWKKRPSDKKKLGDFSIQKWKDNKTPDNTLYNSIAGKWVMAFDNKADQTNRLYEASAGV